MNLSPKQVGQFSAGRRDSPGRVVAFVATLEKYEDKEED